MSNSKEIPKKIIQYWNTNPPKEIINLSSTLIVQNPSFKYELYCREKAIEFLKSHYGSDLANLFSSIIIPAMQSDVFRIAYIFNLGGIYVDMSMENKKPLNNMTNHKIFFVRKQRTNLNVIINGVFGATAKNKILEVIFNTIIDNITQKKEGNLYTITGPYVYTQILKLFENKYFEYSWKEFLEYLRPVHTLNHKSTDNHWSMVQQKLNSLYENR